MATNEFERGWEACRAAALEAMRAWQTDDDCSDTPEQRIRALTPPSGGGEGERQAWADGLVKGAYLRALADVQQGFYRVNAEDGNSGVFDEGDVATVLARLRQGDGK